MCRVVCPIGTIKIKIKITGPEPKQADPMADPTEIKTQTPTRVQARARVGVAPDTAQTHPVAAVITIISGVLRLGSVFNP